jgi:hypothetical protein
MSAPSLLAVVEFLAHNRLRELYAELGYQAHGEFSVRRALAWLRKNRPAVVVADFYFQPDFRDRISNLESLLAALQGRPGVKVLVFHDPDHLAALDKLRQRFRIDAALPTPVAEAELRALLTDWRAVVADQA